MFLFSFQLSGTFFPCFIALDNANSFDRSIARMSARSPFLIFFWQTMHFVSYFSTLDKFQFFCVSKVCLQMQNKLLPLARRGFLLATSQCRECMANDLEESSIATIKTKHQDFLWWGSWQSTLLPFYCATFHRLRFISNIISCIISIVIESLNDYQRFDAQIKFLVRR